MDTSLSPKPFHQYLFFAVDRALHNLSPEIIATLKEEFISSVKSEKKCTVFAYSLLGLKGETAFMLWIQSEDVHHAEKLVSRILKTKFASFLSITQTLFGIIGKSVYAKERKVHEGNVPAPRSDRSPYLIIYPFTKTKEWHLLPLEARKAMMSEHMKIGFGYAHIRQQLLYSYGVDDHEFIVSYETESLEEFQQLVIALRASEGRRYTENDLPIFTCLYGALPDIVELL